MKLYDTYLTVHLDGSKGRVLNAVRKTLVSMLLILLGILAVLTYKPEWQHRFFPRASDLSLKQSEGDVASNGAFVPVKYGQAEEVIKALSPAQQRVVSYLSSRYRVSPEAVEAVVRLAYQVGEEEKVDPTLILAVVGVESGYNPFAGSSMGAKGLMQVMPKLHKEKFDDVSSGEDWSALNPEMNLRVGAQIIHEYTQRAGSVEAGLRWYVGAAVSGEDGGYVSKVLNLKTKIDSVYRSKRLVSVPVPKKPKTLEASASQMES
jgi:Transglycosylase SLT domain